jgi:hypothetical protein
MRATRGAAVLAVILPILLAAACDGLLGIHVIGTDEDAKSATGDASRADHTPGDAAGAERTPGDVTNAERATVDHSAPRDAGHEGSARCGTAPDAGPCDTDATATDPNNCGRCGHSCLEGTCVGGTCQAYRAYPSTGPNPTAIVSDRGSLYWTNATGIDVVPAGMNSPSPFVSGRINPLTLAADSRYIYWSQYLDGGVAALYKSPLDGGNLILLTADMSGVGQTGYVSFPIAVSSSNVYWTFAGYGELRSMSIDGGAVITLQTMENGAGAIATDDVYVYWVDETVAGSLKRVPLDGGVNAPRFTIAANLIGLGPRSDLAVMGGRVYLTEPDGGQVLSVNAQGGSPSPLVTGEHGPTVIAADCTGVYWGDIDGVVSVVGLDGGAIRRLNDAGNTPLGLTLDSTAVYWTSGDGWVWKIAKP